MHFDSILRAGTALAALLGATQVTAMLVPPGIIDGDNAALEHFNALVESLHAGSGAVYDSFKAGLAFQDVGRETITYADDDEDSDNGINKHEQKHGDGDGSVRVPVVLGVMSKCPDAEICESVFDKTLGQVGGIVDLKTVYIGHLNSSVGPYGVQCMHGSHECDGNVQQLCVRDNKHVDQRDWWNFIQCQNFQSLDRVGDISVAKQCAKVIKRNWDDDFSSCYTGKRGAELLRQSVKEANERNITKSCTILINDKLACIHDGSWKDCPGGHEASDFQRTIEMEFKAINGIV